MVPSSVLAVVGTRLLTSSPSLTEVNASRELAQWALRKAMELCQLFLSCLRSEEQTSKTWYPPFLTPSCSPPAIPILQLFHSSSSSSPLPGRQSPHRRPVSKSQLPPTLWLQERSRSCQEAQNLSIFSPAFCWLQKGCSRLVGWGTSCVHQKVWLSYFLLLKGCNLNIGIVQL